MADVFVSYARGDQSHAERIARRLTEAGYTVWWDSELLPHNRFANVIENEIRAARAVLVVWSEAAGQSQWVRAEAELGGKDNKLIQVALDASPIPLPFNQLQVADLQHWRGGSDDPQWRKVLASVAHFVTGGGTEAAAPAPPPKSWSFGRLTSFARSRGILVAGAVGLAIIASGVAYVTFGRPESRGQRIAVQPFRTIGGAPALQDFAAELTDSLRNVLSRDQLQTVSPTEIESLKGDELDRRLKTLGVGLIFSGTVQENGPSASVDMRLDDPAQQATLWTAELSGPAANFDQLQARVGALTVAVLNCSAQALEPGANLSDGALQAFLHACELSETSYHGLSDNRSADAMLDAMRQAARLAPNFAAAHSMLSKHIAFLLPDMPPSQAASLREEATREVRRAQAIDAKDPDAFVTFGLLAPAGDFAEREAFFRQALAINPAWPHANGFLGNVMSDVGRLQDALTLYERAASVNPQSDDWAPEAAAGLIKVGRASEADHELAQFSRLWPDNSLVFVVHLQSLIAQKRWADGVKGLDQAADIPSSLSPEWVAEWRRIYSALQSGDVAKRQSLRESLLASSHADPQRAIERLALLGFVDDAFEVAQKDSRVGTESPDYLFDVETAALRRDPRFIAMAARFGLVDYWRRTGKWPDFCQDPGLPYNCAEEAAKHPSRNRA